ncbi:hypothetical protein BASA60_006479 [Batrachochytrium salamandrivorans]|nr:hypothetical protein BASA60_006479 [Batrachochytrium salamandrivorans]
MRSSIGNAIQHYSKVADTNAQQCLSSTWALVVPTPSPSPTLWATITRAVNMPLQPLQLFSFFCRQVYSKHIKWCTADRGPAAAKAAAACRESSLLGFTAIIGAVLRSSLWLSSVASVNS